MFEHGRNENLKVHVEGHDHSVGIGEVSESLHEFLASLVDAVFEFGLQPQEYTEPDKPSRTFILKHPMRRDPIRRLRLLHRSPKRSHSFLVTKNL